jgi:hypothetical protein
MSRLDQTDLHIDGRLSSKYFTPPAQSIGSAAINTADPLPTAGLVHRHRVCVELFGPTTTITALTKLLAGILGTGTLRAVEVYTTVQATGGDRTVTIDLQKSTGAGAFATVLTGTIGITNATAIRTAVPGTINTAALVDGDILQMTVAVAGAAGAQAQGLLAVLEWDENP